VNDVAKQAVADETTTTSDAPTPFADDSKAAEQVESCVVEASDR
jgi:hypothetical protein